MYHMKRSTWEKLVVIFFFILLGATVGNVTPPKEEQLKLAQRLYNEAYRRALPCQYGEHGCNRCHVQP